MTLDERWLAAVWPVVRERLGDAPARVVELGCGPLGGLVPRLRSAGYEAVGVDPVAPDGDEYRQLTFERFEPAGEVDAVVAVTSLHHVDDPAEVLDRVDRMLAPAGIAAVIEWDWRSFDARTAEWAFDRLGPDGDESWLRGHRERWSASGRPWDEYLADWAAEHGIHAAAELLRLLDERFEREHLATGPYVFSGLPGTGEADERAAVEAGTIKATRVDVVCRRR
ncbi:MAG TPA: methyltransferase domain-containing protein [Gaiella sp.]|nr:methyltransferase domain-containing protein [Gaiella sp.]